MAKNKNVSTEVQSEVRRPIELSQNLPFEAIVAKHEQEFDFCIINDAKGSVQRHEMKGWKVWKGTSIYDSEFEKALEGEASKTQDGFTSVPCGIAADGKQTRAYLMYAPKGTIAKVQKERHNENALRKQSYGNTAKGIASKEVGGVETYTPQGFGVDGMKHMSNTTE